MTKKSEIVNRQKMVTWINIIKTKSKKKTKTGRLGLNKKFIFFLVKTNESSEN